MTLEMYTRKAVGYDRDRTGYSMGKVGRVIIHHFWQPDVPADASPAIERAIMRGVEDYHADKGWSAAPGYQWIICDSGRVYEGVGWFHQGVHTAGYNESSVGICFANNGDADQPTPAAWQAAHELVEWGIDRGAITRDYILNGHRQFASKSCPGDKTWAHITKVRYGVEIEPTPAIQEAAMFCKKGDTSEQVQVLKIQLRKLGFFDGPMDEIYGQGLADALLAFRQSIGSSATSGDAYDAYAYTQVQDALIRKFTTPV